MEKLVDFDDTVTNMNMQMFSFIENAAYLPRVNIDAQNADKYGNKHDMEKIFGQSLDTIKVIPDKNSSKRGYMHTGFDPFEMDNSASLWDDLISPESQINYATGDLQIPHDDNSLELYSDCTSPCVSSTHNIKNKISLNSSSAASNPDEKTIIFCNISSETETTGNLISPLESASSTLSLVISNVVCTFSTKCHLNLKKIAMEGCNVEYKRNAGRLTMMIRKPCGYANIWASGKVTCTGTTSEADAKTLSRRVARCIQKLGFNAKICNYRIVNVFSGCSLPFGIDLIQLYKQCQSIGFISMIQYEPELHPGATIKIKDLSVTLKVFATGSVTVIGPSVSSVKEASSRMYHIFKRCSRFSKF